MNIYMVGIKGSGMTSLACILKKLNHNIKGSDLGEKFFTDDILKKYKIEFVEDFSSSIGDVDMLIHSSAYLQTNPQILEAKNKGIKIFSYPQALGYFSSSYKSICITGIHGKTSITSLLTKIMMDLKKNFISVIGSGMKNLDGDNFFFCKDAEWFLVESCEYKRHFLNFLPTILLISSIELDHTDYYKDISDVMDAFYSLCLKIKQYGILIYHKEENTEIIVKKLKKVRKDIKLISYGEGSDFFIEDEYANGEFDVKNNFESIRIKSQDFLEHAKTNILGSLALISQIDDLKNKDILKNSIDCFLGNKRRCEFFGYLNGIYFYDDYAHHPTAIKKTLEGFRSKYSKNRIICSFASHTFSRTYTLLDDFIKCFDCCDLLIIHQIYGSRRESGSQKITSESFFESIKHNNKLYHKNYYDSFDYLVKNLCKDDVFLSMGAGDNCNLTYKLVDFYKNI